MFIIFRWWYFAGVAGIGLTVYGGVESRLAMQSASEPIAVTIDDLENGKPLAQPFVRLGAHIALEPFGVETRKGKTNRVEKAAFPLLAREHASAREIAAAGRGSSTRRPELPEVHVFALRGSRAKTVPLASRSSEVDAAEGTVFDYDGLSKDEQKMIRAICPAVDKAKVRVLEIGRRPRPLALTIGVAVAGLALLGLAIRLFRGPRSAKPMEPPRQKKVEDPEKPFLYEGLDKRSYR